jgi:hypothetical protein
MANDYTDNDYDELEAALFRSQAIKYGSPDQYQYYQNELSKHIATFLLKPYLKSKIKLKIKDEQSDTIL